MLEGFKTMTDEALDETTRDGVLTANRRRFMRAAAATAAVSGMSMRALADHKEPSFEDFAGPEDWHELILESGLPDNWCRWGDDDGLGAINLLGSEQTFEGMKAATKRGKKAIERFTLQIPMTGGIDRDGITDEKEESADPIAASRIPAVRDNTGPKPVENEDGEEVPPEGFGVGLGAAGDKFVNPSELNLQGTTHLDSLGHVWVGDQIYNGFDAETTFGAKRTYEGDYDGDEEDETIETHGLAKADITNAATAGVVGRGVLLDVARYVNGNDDPLPLGYGIGLDDLQATAEAQGIDLQERDILLVRTGGLKRFYEPEYDWGTTIFDPEAVEPGLQFEPELVEWVHEMDIPVIGADNIAVEKIIQWLESPADGEEKLFAVPLHPAMLQLLGVALNEILWLEDLAENCDEDGIYDFMYASAPLNVERSTGAPMNPIIMKATGGNGGR